MIKLDGVTKRFDKYVAVDNIQLEIPKGSIYGLLGSNGAGKSTILRILSGVYKADSGRAEIDGEIIYNNPSAKEKVFFVNDETIQYTNFTLLDLAKYYSNFYPNYSNEKFEKLCGILQLPKKKKLSTFSKGMKRQAIVICALACQPEYLLLDEAFDGLDPTMRIIVKRMVVDEMLDREMTTVISSHNLKEIDDFCDTVGMLHKGKIVFNKELDSVKGNIHKIQTAFDADYSERDFEGIEILHFEKNGSIVYIIAKGDEKEIEKKIRDKEPKIFDMVPLSLEEVFIYEMEGLGYEFNEVSQ